MQPGPGVAFWLRRCAASRRVPGSIPGRVTGEFFRGIRQVHVPEVDSGFRNEYQDIPGGKDGRCVVSSDNLTTLMCRLSRKPGALTSRTPQGHVGLFRGYFTFFLCNLQFHYFVHNSATDTIFCVLLCKIRSCIRQSIANCRPNRKSG
jgi:hypothetical protein